MSEQLSVQWGQSNSSAHIPAPPRHELSTLVGLEVNLPQQSQFGSVAPLQGESTSLGPVIGSVMIHQVFQLRCDSVEALHVAGWAPIRAPRGACWRATVDTGSTARAGALVFIVVVLPAHRVRAGLVTHG